MRSHGKQAHTLTFLRHIHPSIHPTPAQSIGDLAYLYDVNRVINQQMICQRRLGLINQRLRAGCLQGAGDVTTVFTRSRAGMEAGFIISLADRMAGKAYPYFSLSLRIHFH